MERCPALSCFDAPAVTPRRGVLSDFDLICLGHCEVPDYYAFRSEMQVNLSRCRSEPEF